MIHELQLELTEGLVEVFVFLGHGGSPYWVCKENEPAGQSRRFMAILGRFAQFLVLFEDAHTLELDYLGEVHIELAGLDVLDRFGEFLSGQITGFIINTYTILGFASCETRYHLFRFSVICLDGDIDCFSSVEIGNIDLAVDIRVVLRVTYNDRQRGSAGCQ